MLTFIIGLVILIGGGLCYGKFCENVFAPDDRETPAYARQDGVDYVPMKTWRNSLINLLNIAGTGPILGPIQGILFGPAAFLAIPIGNVIGGSMHDYFSGMICTRDGGTQMPDFVKNYTNKAIYVLYDIFICVLLLLVGAVFIYTPGDIATTQVFKWSGAPTDPTTWIVYLVIFAYYLVATVLPIDKLIGRVYPIFGAILIFSAIGIFIAIFAKGYPLNEIWEPWNMAGAAITGVGADGAAVELVEKGFRYGDYFNASHFVPVFFLTVACGILSGFHSTQTALVARTIESEKNGRTVFYNMMLVEGFIAMCWAAGTMAMINLGAEAGGLSMMGSKYLQLAAENKAVVDGAVQASYIAGDNGLFYHVIGAAAVTGVLCRNALGNIGGTIALLGVIILPITSGDTALRALRLTLADSLHIRQENNKQRLGLAVPIFALVFIILVWAKFNSNGFNMLWRYFSWANQMISMFAFACVAAYLYKQGKARFVWIPMVPACFYAFATCAFLVHDPTQSGREMMSWTAAYAVAAVWTVCYLGFCIWNGRQQAKKA
ncbi:carbon starvation CstA family protein [Lachnoclostridium sp. Marseille-P6806]|uniref:carbon starvation CstA family protein n=1 Tax=Lachnoclostridium sp. Marseille-P6806 TaxID=2364793 RepID=UPI00103026FD|nr:carbon starvation CstA family protein [Lachnoclostridium sp. Marseille-P6806]